MTITRRYVKQLGSVGIGSAAAVAYIVIRTDEVPHHEVIARGFDEVPTDLTDDEVKAKYGVTTIAVVTNEQIREKVN